MIDESQPTGQGADGEIRTLTDGDLNAVPLPVGLRRLTKEGYARREAERPGPGIRPDGGDADARRRDGRFGRLLHRHRAKVLTALVGGAAIVATWALVAMELRSDPLTVEWPAFVVIATILLGCERSPGTWIRFGTGNVVTPLYLFAFGLMLVGSPALAVGVALLGGAASPLRGVETTHLTILRIAGTALSLSVAGVVLIGLGVRGSITQFGYLPTTWAAAVVAAGGTIIILNSALLTAAVAVRRRVSFLVLAQRGLTVRITAEGALLSLAPIWVVGVDFGIVFAPILAITTVLVFRSTRQALERSHEAHHDPLTGLINRRSFLDSLDETLEEAHPRTSPTLLLMDLDGFKDINDRLGHQLGDSLLVAFGSRLRDSVPPASVAGRFGGDEFAVLLVDHDEHQIRSLHDALVEPLTVEGFPVSVRVSIGVARSPVDGRTSRDLLRAADVAMYKAKRTGSSVEYYDTCVKGPQRGRLNLLADLGDALDNDELFIHFQPQLRLNSGEIDTVEALVRWQHPRHGEIPPEEFIGLAEQTDLIGPITEFVLRVGATGLLNSGVDARLAVNVSPRDLQDPEFATHVLHILQTTGFRADRLELEVTERSIVTNAERCRFTIDRLRAHGVRVAIDDFGIGYSSFQALRVLDVDRIKIDRDFVTGIVEQARDRVIVASAIELAHELGLDVVAEGVENLSLWSALAELNCDVAQGFGIAAPMAYPELRGWLSTWSEVLLDQAAQSRSDAHVVESDVPGGPDGSRGRDDADDAGGTRTGAPDPEEDALTVDRS